MDNKPFMPQDFIEPTICPAEVKPSENGFEATIPLELELKPSISAEMQGASSSENGTHRDHVFCSIIGAALVNPQGIVWTPMHFPDPLARTNVWPGRKGRVRIKFTSSSLKLIEDGTRLTFSLSAQDRKAAQQELNYVYENHAWRLTEKSAAKQAAEHVTKPQRRVRN